ncbi:MAG: hypothetical protein FH756_17355 [Firmicutes bacterium]|nr:hypothetical protein [Bacillota bacterium]
MQKSVTASFVDKVELQVLLNRMMHGDQERPEIEWVAIAATHMGHLMEAVLSGDKGLVEKELLHTSAPLMELYRTAVRGSIDE